MTELNIDLVKYDITAPSITEMKEQFSGMVITDKESYKAVANAIGVCRGHRTAVEKRRKELKAESLEFGRMVDSRAKEITTSLLEIEEPLKAMKKVEDDKAAAIEAEKEAKEEERKTRIMARITSISDLNSPDIINMDSAEIRKVRDSLIDLEITSGDFEEFMDQAERIKANVLGVIQKALDERLAFEAAAVKAKEEADRLVEEREAQAAKDKELAEREAELAKKEIAAKAEEDRKGREEFERKAKEEARIQAEKDAKEKAEREEANRLIEIEHDRVAKEEAEKAEAEEKARQEALKPDKEKLEGYRLRLLEVTEPELNSEEAIQAMRRFQLAFEGLVGLTFKSDIENL